MVRILNFHCHGLGSFPGRGIEVPQAAQCGKKNKTKPKTIDMYYQA